MTGEKVDGVEYSFDGDDVAAAGDHTTASKIMGHKEGGRPSLSDWYRRPEISSDDSDNASNAGGEGDHISEDVDVVRPSLSTTSAQTPRRKRVSLGDWWLNNERRPSNWTPDTKVIYLGEDWDELAREWQPDSHCNSTPTRAGLHEAEDAMDTAQRRRRRHSLHITRAPAEAVASIPPAHGFEDSDVQESQRYVVHLFSDFGTDVEDAEDRQTRATAKALPTSPSKRSSGATASCLQESKALEVHLISGPYSDSDSDEPKKHRRRRHSLQMTRETAEALAEVFPVSPSECSKATTSQTAPLEQTNEEHLTTLEDFLAPETLDQFLQRPATQNMLDDSERSPALTKFWEALVEIFTDAKAAAYDLTLYVLDPVRNDLSCMPSPDVVSYRKQLPSESSSS
mmetsp:Transcript_104368/g.164689  ORF Transcript_104368/g.164689 Transcript_104368/m.164689 type:complete len:398 (-) Transcript_104368:134-1327(-)